MNLDAQDHSLVIAEVSVSSWYILVNDSHSFLELCDVERDPLKQNLQEKIKCDYKYSIIIIITISSE